MRSQLIVHKASQNIFWGYAILLIATIFATILFEELMFMALPIAFLVVLQAVFDYEKLYLLLFACIPLSLEFSFSRALATDLPTEPLIVGLTVIYIIHLLSKPNSFDIELIKHPITVIILLHLVWILITTLASTHVNMSLKFFIAKLWYVVVFYFLTNHIIHSEKKIRTILWLVLIPLSLATLKVFIHHAVLSFGFKEINAATSPFFRNHVSYAAILTLVIPFVWYLHKWSKGLFLNKNTARVIGIFLLIAIFFSYTRAAYIALLLAFGGYWVIRFRLILPSIVASVFIVASVLIFLVTENTFMEYAPTEKTVSHVDFDEIMASTHKLEDVSTMERYYRWIAGARMVATHPLLGFGPSSFYEEYKHYALARFSTYVSANPERSGVHNYYLMTFVEQGLPGFIIFMALVFFVLIYGQGIYHNTPKENKSRRDLVMAMLLSLIIIDAFQIINDLIETDKIGSFFFFNTSVLIILEKLNKKEASTDLEEQ